MNEYRITETPKSKKNKINKIYDKIEQQELNEQFLHSNLE